MDVPMPHGAIVMLTFPTVQGLCRKCDRFVTTCPEEVHPTCHATWRLMRLISAWASVATNSEVAVMFDISDGTVSRYDKIVLESDTPPPLLDGITKLLIDEKSVRKGHGYATVVLNGDTGELLHMAEGKKREALDSFFEKLTEAQRASIVAVGIDRGGPIRRPSRLGCRKLASFTTVSTSWPTSTKPSMKCAAACAAKRTRRKERFSKASASWCSPIRTSSMRTGRRNSRNFSRLTNLSPRHAHLKNNSGRSSNTAVRVGHNGH